jgi:hypothetical protein
LSATQLNLSIMAHNYIDVNCTEDPPSLFESTLKSALYSNLKPDLKFDSKTHLKTTEKRPSNMTSGNSFHPHGTESTLR